MEKSSMCHPKKNNILKSNSLFNLKMGPALVSEILAVQLKQKKSTVMEYIFYFTLRTDTNQQYNPVSLF
jgi:hypothetical protein